MGNLGDQVQGIVGSSELKSGDALPMEPMERPANAMEYSHCLAGREVTDRCLIMEINFYLMYIDTKTFDC